MVDITRVRRESLRWSLLVALNKTRPYTASETLLLDVSRAIYPTPHRWNRAANWIIWLTVKWLSWRKNLLATGLLT